jgi:hypothetical protein
VRRGAAVLRQYGARWLSPAFTAEELVAYGLAQARRHGIASEDGVMRYVVLMLLFGRDFPEDPRMGWAASVLAEEGLVEKAKLFRLYEEAARVLGRPVEEVVG